MGYRALGTGIANPCGKTVEYALINVWTFFAEEFAHAVLFLGGQGVEDDCECAQVWHGYLLGHSHDWYGRHEGVKLPISFLCESQGV